MGGVPGLGGVGGDEGGVSGGGGSCGVVIGGFGGGDGGGGEGEGGGGEGEGRADVHEGIAREVTLEERPGIEMSSVYVGPSPPLAHSQHGSPSSKPLDWPSPSVSASQSATVQEFPAL